MSDIFETVQANIIPIALSLIVIGVGINLLKGEIGRASCRERV